MKILGNLFLASVFVSVQNVASASTMDLKASNGTLVMLLLVYFVIPLAVVVIKKYRLKSISLIGVTNRSYRIKKYAPALILVFGYFLSLIILSVTIIFTTCTWWCGFAQAINLLALFLPFVFSVIAYLI